MDAQLLLPRLCISRLTVRNDKCMEKEAIVSAPRAPLDASEYPDLIWCGSDGFEIEWAARYLANRGVDPDVAEARGYYVPERPVDWGSKVSWSRSVRPDLHADKDYMERWDGMGRQRPLSIPLFQRNGMCSTEQLRPEKPVPVEEVVVNRLTGEPIMVRSTVGVDRPKLDSNGVQEIYRSGDRKGELKTEKTYLLVPKTKAREMKFLLAHNTKRGVGAGTVPTPDVHPFVAEVLNDETPGYLTPALVVEGVVKADAVLSAARRSDRELATLALTGVTMGFAAPNSDSNPTDKPALTDGMRQINWDAREVFLCFDADWRTNSQVAKALKTTAELLEAEGAIVKIVDIPEQAHAKGIDDFIVQHGDTAFWNLLENCKSRSDVERFSTVYPRTDLGRGERLAREMLQPETGYRFIANEKHSLRWDGTRWVDDHSDTILVSLAGKLAKRDPEDEYGQSLRGLEAAVKLAKGHPGTVISANDLDSDPYAFVARNVTIDLRTGEAHPHDPAQLLTKRTAVDYDPELPTPIWNRMLETITQGDKEFQKHLQLIVGLSAIGEIIHPLIVVPIGPANTWKSVFTSTLMKVFGEYATSAQAEKFLDKPDNELISSLIGKRYVGISEAGNETRVSDSVIKSMTSPDMTKARGLYKSSCDFIPTWTLWLPANHRLGVDSADGAIWKRLTYIPFRHVIVDGSPDYIPFLKEKLAAELPGILAWILAGAAEFLQGDRSLPTCAAVRAETAKQRKAGDPVDAWLEDKVVIADTFTNRKEVLDSFREFQTEANIRATWTMDRLKSALKDRGVVKDFTSRSGVLTDEKVNNGQRFWKGLRLKTAQEHRVDDQVEEMLDEDAVPDTLPAEWATEQSADSAASPSTMDHPTPERPASRQPLPSWDDLVAESIRKKEEAPIGLNS
ncbi:phage/plasmid primase, P4 family [Diaminobutyricibacter sp. McL0618]|uniref:phage/plasmid primase, P4 family n=1 Tax=Leifsonia sp. McL0618 TaxID=3415677 RepID=UPI003CEC748B